MQIDVGLDNEGRHSTVKQTSKCLHDGTHGRPHLAELGPMRPLRRLAERGIQKVQS